MCAQWAHSVHSENLPVNDPQTKREGWNLPVNDPQTKGEGWLCVCLSFNFLLRLQTATGRFDKHRPHKWVWVCVKVCLVIDVAVIKPFRTVYNMMINAHKVASWLHFPGVCMWVYMYTYSAFRMYSHPLKRLIALPIFLRYYFSALLQNRMHVL